MKAQTTVVALIILASGVRLAAAEFAGSDINIHSGPSTKHGVVAVLPQCSEVRVNARQGGWCSITYGRSLGWVPCDQLTKACTNVESEETADSPITTEGTQGQVLAPGLGNSSDITLGSGGRIVGPSSPVGPGGTYD